jgi:nucleotide-binding universal stress UspA family protein
MVLLPKRPTHEDSTGNRWSPCSQAAIDEVCARPWPENTEVKVLTVVFVRGPAFDPILLTLAIHELLMDKARKVAPEILEKAANQIRERAPGLKVETRTVEEEPPKQAIVEKAERWGADLIMIGSHGYGPAKRFLLGSTAQAVTLHAPCSVEIVRRRHLHEESSS